MFDSSLERTKRLNDGKKQMTFEPAMLQTCSGRGFPIVCITKRALGKKELVFLEFFLLLFGWSGGNLLETFKDHLAMLLWSYSDEIQSFIWRQEIQNIFITGLIKLLNIFCWYTQSHFFKTRLNAINPVSHEVSRPRLKKYYRTL